MRHLTLLIVLLALLSRAAPSAAEGSAPVPSGTAALPELPHLAPISQKDPDPAAIRELDRILGQLTSASEGAHKSGKAAIPEVQPSIVPAIHHRVQEIRGALDREVAPKMLEAARKAGRKALKKEAKAAKEKGEKAEPRKKKGKDDADDDGDWLDFVLVTPHEGETATWRHLVSLLAMERMLTAVGSTPAVRELIAFHAYFGELFRIDLQRQVTKLKDKAVPALLEARQHDAKIIQRWATKQLDIMGRAIPGETVSSDNRQILADVLRAYGRTRDVDAVRVVLSFCNNDDVQLREAARESVAAIGEPGLWQLRDQYLSLSGNKAPKEWTWDRIARELFALYDRARLSEVYKAMDEGVAAERAGKIADAVAAFDKVLARAPLFERRKEMVKAYFARAKELQKEHREDALAMLRKALRLDPKGALSAKIESEIDTIEGVLSIESGTPDKAILEKAIALDATNEAAKSALASLEEKAVQRESGMKRYFAAGGVGLAAILAMILLVRRGPKKGNPSPPAPPEPPAPPPAPPSIDAAAADPPAAS